MSKWFISLNEEVSGPFTEEELRANDSIAAGSLVWGNPLTSWIPFESWSDHLAHLKSEIIELKRKQQIMWHYAVNKESFGPYTRKELIDEIHLRDNKDRILLWTKSYTNWVSIFECHDILDELDINRRKVPRVYIGGQAVVKQGDFSAIVNLTTLSHGGFGSTFVEGLIQGTEYDIELKTDQLHNSVKCKCEARYISEKCMGFKFTQIHTEAKVMIMDFVNNAPATQAA